MKLSTLPARPAQFTVTLRRDGVRTPWGIRLTGGADLGAPLVVTRAQVGTPAEGELKRGDIIRKIGDYDARDLRHEDAQALFRSAGNQIKVVVERSGAGAALAAAGPGASSSLQRARTQPLPALRGPVSPRASPAPQPLAAAPPPRPPVAGGVATPFAMAALPPRPGTPGGAAVPPPRNLPISFPPPLPSDKPLEEDINTQPYRTTPLVLPGAKVKKDAPANESYLRHHPNPMFRAPPSHYDQEVLMKQKVADTVLQRVVGEEAAGKQVVHKQFNSPIGLYSEQNIVDTIQTQTGVTPVRAPTLDRRNQAPVSLKKTYVYDPSKSETFKAIQESELGDNIQEVTQPVQPKVFSPTKNLQAKKPAPAPQQTYVNSLGNMEQNIQQSGSFRRLMNQVLGESEY